MKKYIMFIALLITCSFLLIACSDDNNDQNTNDNDSENNAKETVNNQKNNNDDENLESNHNQQNTDEESEALDETDESIDTDIEQIEDTIEQEDLLDEESLDMEDEDLDWEIEELMNLNNKTISFVDDKAFFTYDMKTYPLDMKDLEFSDEIDVESDAQMVSYDDQLVFLDSDEDHIRLHYIDPSSEEVTDTVEEDIKELTDFPIENVFLHGDKLIGVPDFVGNIYVFDLSEKSLEEVIDVGDVLDKDSLVPFGFDDGLMYMGMEGTDLLYAYDIDEEEVAWESELSEAGIHTNLEVPPTEPMFDGDHMHVLMKQEAYLELDKNSGKVEHVADLHMGTHMLDMTNDHIFFSSEHGTEDRSFMYSLDKDTLEPEWAIEIEENRTELSGTVHEDDLYVAAINQHGDSDGTYWYKIDIDSGEVQAKDTIEELDNREGNLLFEIQNDKMLLSDGDSLAFTSLE